MRIKFTDRELVVLGWDDPGLIATMRREGDPTADVADKCDGRHDLTDQELDLVRRSVKLLARFACDRKDSATATRLARKVGLED